MRARRRLAVRDAGADVAPLARRINSVWVFHRGIKDPGTPRGPAATGNPPLEAGPWRGRFLGGADSRFPQLSPPPSRGGAAGSGSIARQGLAALLDGLAETLGPFQIHPSAFKGYSCRGWRAT